MSTANQFRPTLRGASCPMSYEFGPFVLDKIQHALLREGNPVPLAPKSYDTLLVLVQNSGRMLAKEELMKALWPDSFVEESNLTQQVSMIRRALGESPGDPRYVATVPSRGYPFGAQVRNRPEEKPKSDLPGAPVGSSSGEIDRRNGIPSSTSSWGNVARFPRPLPA